MKLNSDELFHLNCAATTVTVASDGNVRKKD